MPAINQNIDHWVGDSRVLHLGPIVDQDGVIVDLTGGSARWWMGKNVSATGTDVYLKKSSDDVGLAFQNVDGGWVVVVTIDAADTEGRTPGTFYHECEVVDVAGKVSTVTTGKFVLKPTMIPDNL